MKYIVIITNVYLLIGCCINSEKSWHISPTYKDRIENYYPFIWIGNVEKIKPGITIKEAESIIGYNIIGYKNHPTTAIFYSDIGNKNYIEIAFKLSDDKSKIEDVDFIKLKLGKINKDVFKGISLIKHDDQPIYSFHSLKKYTNQDADQKWEEEAGLYIDYENNIITIGITYLYQDYIILNTYGKDNELYMYIQSTSVYDRNSDKGKVKLVKIRFFRKDNKLEVEGFDFGGIYFPGIPKTYEVKCNR